MSEDPRRNADPLQSVDKWADRWLKYYGVALSLLAVIAFFGNYILPYSQIVAPIVALVLAIVAVIMTRGGGPGTRIAWRYAYTIAAILSLGFWGHSLVNHQVRQHTESELHGGCRLQLVPDAAKAVDVHAIREEERERTEARMNAEGAARISNLIEVVTTWMWWVSSMFWFLALAHPTVQVDSVPSRDERGG